MAKNIWVFCEQRDGEIQNVALELLGVARELAEKTGEKVNAARGRHFQIRSNS